jgi:hypothetical protein
LGIFVDHAGRPGVNHDRMFIMGKAATN